MGKSKHEDREVMFAKKTTNAKSLAKAIVASYHNGNNIIYIRGVGGGAITQMVYAVTIAAGIFEQKNISFRYKHYYQDIPNERYVAGEGRDLNITSIEYKLIIGDEE